MNKERFNIIRFLDGDMSSVERTNFSNEIERNSNLKIEVEKIKRTLDYFNPNELNLDSHYYQTILPRFHNRRLKGKQIDAPIAKKFALNFLPALALIIITYIGFANLTVKELSSEEFLSQNKSIIASELIDDEVVFQYGQMSNIVAPNIGEDKIEKEFSSLLSIDDSDLLLMNASLNDLSSLIEDLSEDEYAELLNEIDI